MGLPLALFLPVFARLLKKMWRDAKGLTLTWYRLALIPVTFILIYITIYVLRSARYDYAHLVHFDGGHHHLLLQAARFSKLAAHSRVITGLQQHAITAHQLVAEGKTDAALDTIVRYGMAAGAALGCARWKTLRGGKGSLPGFTPRGRVRVRGADGGKGG